MRTHLALTCLERIAPETDVMGWAVSKGLKLEQDRFNDPYFVGSSIIVNWDALGFELADQINSPAIPGRNKKYRNRRKPIQLTHEEIAEEISQLRAQRGAA
jgi:hypothetical protein